MLGTTFAIFYRQDLPLDHSYSPRGGSSERLALFMKGVRYDSLWNLLCSFTACLLEAMSKKNNAPAGATDALHSTD